MVEYLDAAKGWLDGGDNADKMPRLYTQESHPARLCEAPRRTVPAPPYVIENAEKRVRRSHSNGRLVPLAKQQMALDRLAGRASSSSPRRASSTR